MSDWLVPQLSIEAQAFVRAGYGLLLTVTLLMAFRHGRRFFLSERWGGYGESSFMVDAIQNPLVYPFIVVGWLTCALLIMLGISSVAVSAVNLVLCRYFFVQMRWKGVLRGLGAPGFMTYWMAGAVFVLELTARYAPGWHSLGLLVLQLDFALIMLSSGIYKSTAGYARNEGMEFGLVNPQWGYWHTLYSRLSPKNPLFRFFNHCGWSVQIISAVLMLNPLTRPIGAVMIVGSFVFVALQIRLGVLCQVVMLGSVLFFPAGGMADGVVRQLTPDWAVTTETITLVPPIVSTIIAVALWTYLALLPLSHAGLFYNFYARRPLKGILQRALEAYTNFFGIIIWRVFSADHTNFFVRIYQQPRGEEASRELISHYSRFGGRFNHVGECITITSIFTTLKYYPSDKARFHERLLRYARTLPLQEDALLVFEYVSIRKIDSRFEYVPVTDYVVDPRTSTVTERSLDRTVSVQAPHRVSPVFEGARPGSYVPLKG